MHCSSLFAVFAAGLLLATVAVAGDDVLSDVALRTVDDAPTTVPVMAADSKKYDTVILGDPDLSLAKAWRLGDCNETSVVVVVGADKKVKYVKKGPIRGAEIDAVVAPVASLVAHSADAGS